VRRALGVQAAQYAAQGSGVVVLDERDALADSGVEVALVERFIKMAACVGVTHRFDAFEFGQVRAVAQGVHGFVLTK